MSKQSIKEQLAGYFSTHTQTLIKGSDLFDQKDKDKWTAFYRDEDVNVSLTDTADQKKKSLSKTNEESKGQKKLYDAAVKHGLFKKSQTLSQEVKDSAILPFTSQPLGLGDIEVIPLSQQPLEVQLGIITPPIDDGKQQAGSLLASMFKDRTIMTKMKKAVKTANKKTRDRTVKQEQELKETKSKLALIEQTMETKNNRLEQDAQARIATQERVYKNMLAQERASNMAKLDPKEVAKQEEEYKIRFQKEAKAQQDKIRLELQQQLEAERNAKLATEQKLQESRKSYLEGLNRAESEVKQKELEYQKQINELKSFNQQQVEKLTEQKLKELQIAKLQLARNTILNKKRVSAKEKKEADKKQNEIELLKKELQDQINDIDVEARTTAMLERIRRLKQQREQALQADEQLFAEEQKRTKLEEKQKKILEAREKVRLAELQIMEDDLEQQYVNQMSRQNVEDKQKEQELKEINVEQAQEIARLQNSNLANLAQNLAIPAVVAGFHAMTTKGSNLPSIGSAALFAGLNYMANPNPDKKQENKKEARKPKIDKDPDEPQPERKEPETKEREVKVNTAQNLLQQSLTILGSGVVAQEIMNEIPPTSDIYRGLLRLTGVNVENIRDGEITYPGYNFLGPGTQINARLEEGIEPINTLDKIAYEHDIEYSRSRNAIDIDNADQKMIQLIDQLLPNDGFAQLIAYTLRAKRLYEGNVGLLPHSQSVVEYNVNNLEQNDVDAYNNLLKRSRKLTYDMDPNKPPPQPAQPTAEEQPQLQPPTVEAVEPQTQPPTVEASETQPDIKTTQTINNIINMADSKTVPRLTANLQTPANPNPFTLPPELKTSIGSRRGQPIREVKENKITYVAPRLPDRPPIRNPVPGPQAVEDQNNIEAYRGDELQRGAGILKPKFIMPSVNILNRSDQEGYVDDLEFAMFDFVQDEGGNDPNGKNPLVKDQNINNALRYAGGGITVNSMFGEDLASYPAIFPKDKPDRLAESRIQEFFFGENRLPEMKFLYSNEFEAQEFNQSEFEVNEYDVNNERTAISAFSPYADFTNNQLLDQFIDSSILYGVVP
jgi:hypothetical protein